MVKNFTLKLRDLQNTKLVCNNQAALHISSNLIIYEQTKHIKIDCYYVRDTIHLEEITTNFVKFKYQLADTFTKSLMSSPVHYICNKLNSFDIYGPT